MEKLKEEIVEMIYGRLPYSTKDSIRANVDDILSLIAKTNGGAEVPCNVGLSDSDLLDFLEVQNEKRRYTGLCIYRESTTGRGWRLHETSDKRAYGSVRAAIRAAIEEGR